MKLLMLRKVSPSPVTFKIVTNITLTGLRYSADSPHSPKMFPNALVSSQPVGMCLNAANTSK